ncbi:MAG TPA: lipopolysaccharide heptosyltransferase II [Candidatus Nanoarchaeia archaeon]|nr:lipopolysaccharide heptosyltransferase II [Candidatus Nanoarchaeia archaeon]
MEEKFRVDGKMRNLICFLGKAAFLFKHRNVNLNPEPKKILIMRSGAIGDVVMTTPLIKAIRKKFPSAEIDYLIGNWSKKVLEGNPQLNRIISFDDKIVYEKNITGVWKLIKEIRTEQFDLAIVLDKSYHWGVLAYLMGIKQRIGFDRFGEGFAHNLSIFYDGSKYEGDYNLKLVELLGISGEKIADRQMKIPLSEAEEDFATAFFRKNKIKGRTIGIIAGGAKNPGQTMDLKRWPLESYISLIRTLSKDYNVLLLGGPSDKDVSERIGHEIKSANLFDAIGQCGIKESVALMKRCELVVTHDTGPLHMAAATGTKVIALFGPTPAHRFAPRNAVVLETKTEKCPCYDIHGNYTACAEPECMKKISVEMVLDKIKESF